MNKITTTFLSLIIPMMMTGQNINNSMENTQIPQEGRSNSKVAYLGKSVGQMIYEFMEKEKRYCRI